MPISTNLRYQFMGRNANEQRGFATLAREGDGVIYEIPMEWLPTDLERGSILEVITDDTETVIFRQVSGPGSRINVDVNSHMQRTSPKD